MKRSTLYSITLLVALAIGAYLALHREGEMSSTGSSGKMLVDYDSSSVDKLEISNPSHSVVLEKRGGVWMLTSPIEYEADEAAATAAVGRGRRIELSNLISDNPDKQDLFQVDSTGTHVRVYANGTLKASFYVGKAGSSYSETYVRLDGSNDVQLARDVLSSIYNKQPKDWRDKTIFKADEGSIKNVKFQYGDTTFTLSQPDSMWLVDKDSANQSAVKSLLTTVSHLQTDEFVDSMQSSPPKISAIITVGGTQLRFYKNADSKYLVQSSDSPQWFEMQGYRTTNLLKRKKDFLPVK